MRSVSSTNYSFVETNEQHHVKKNFSSVLRDIELRGKYINIANLILEQNLDEAISLLKKNNLSLEVNTRLFNQIFIKCADQRPDVKNSQELYSKVSTEIRKDLYSKLSVMALKVMCACLVVGKQPHLSANLASTIFSGFLLGKSFVETKPIMFWGTIGATFACRALDYNPFIGCGIGVLLHKIGEDRLQKFGRSFQEGITKTANKSISTFTSTDVKEKTNPVIESGT